MPTSRRMPPDYRLTKPHGDRTTLTLRMPRILRDAVMRRARTEGMSMNDYIVRQVEKCAAAQENAP